MVLLYMVCHGSHQEIPPNNVSINIPAPWIRHGKWINVVFFFSNIWAMMKYVTNDAAVFVDVQA